jgi:hypothetical protein
MAVCCILGSNSLFLYILGLGRWNRYMARKKNDILVYMIAGIGQSFLVSYISGRAFSWASGSLDWWERRPGISGLWSRSLVPGAGEISPLSPTAVYSAANLVLGRVSGQPLR